VNECKKHYNKIVKNPANFGLDKRSYETGWRDALGFLQSLYKKYDLEDWDSVACQIKEDIKQELLNNQTDNSPN